MVMGVAGTVEGVIAGINSADHVKSREHRLDFEVGRYEAKNDKDLIEHCVRGFHLQKVIEVDVF
jgi:hypothetical protein